MAPGRTRRPPDIRFAKIGRARCELLSQWLERDVESHGTGLLFGAKLSAIACRTSASPMRRSSPIVSIGWDHTAGVIVPSTSPKPTRYPSPWHQPRMVRASPSSRNERLLPSGISTGSEPFQEISSKLPR
jgi:hypothetical protein